MLRQLWVIARLGHSRVSAQLLVEAWHTRGLEVDDVFFLHLDVLFECGFLVVDGDSVTAGVALNDQTNALPLEMQVSITLSGQDFLQRYGTI